MGKSRRFRFLVSVVAMLTAAVVASQFASAGSREEPIAVELVVMTQASTTGCHGSTFAVVDDLPDAAEYRVTWTSTTAPGREYTQVFNRHNRGKLQFSKFPTWSPGTGRIAGLLVANSSDGPGTAEADCTNVRAMHQARYAVARASVIRYTPTAPAPKAAAYQLSSVAVAQQMHGPTGMDACTVGHFVSFPAVRGRCGTASRSPTRSPVLFARTPRWSRRRR